MDDIKESIIQHCLNLLKRQDVKDELKAVMRPVIDMLLRQIYTLYLFIHNFRLYKFSLNFRNIHFIIA